MMTLLVSMLLMVMLAMLLSGSPPQWVEVAVGVVQIQWVGDAVGIGDAPPHMDGTLDG